MMTNLMAIFFSKKYTLYNQAVCVWERDMGETSCEIGKEDKNWSDLITKLTNQVLV